MKDKETSWLHYKIVQGIVISQKKQTLARNILNSKLFLVGNKSETGIAIDNTTNRADTYATKLNF